MTRRLSSPFPRSPSPSSIYYLLLLLPLLRRLPRLPLLLRESLLLLLGQFPLEQPRRFRRRRRRFPPRRTRRSARPSRRRRRSRRVRLGHLNGDPRGRSRAPSEHPSVAEHSLAGVTPDRGPSDRDLVAPVVDYRRSDRGDDYPADGRSEICPSSSSVVVFVVIHRLFAEVSRSRARRVRVRVRGGG